MEESSQNNNEAKTHYPKVSREERDALRRHRKKYEEAKKRQMRKTILALVSFAVMILIILSLVMFGKPSFMGGKKMEVPTFKR